MHCLQNFSQEITRKNLRRLEYSDVVKQSILLRFKIERIRPRNSMSLILNPPFKSKTYLNYKSFSKLIFTSFCAQSCTWKEFMSFKNIWTPFLASMDSWNIWTLLPWIYIYMYLICPGWRVFLMLDQVVPITCRGFMLFF